MFYLVFGLKPSCTGEPLDPLKFSKPGDVGYIRDMCVDQVARRLYNTLGYKVLPLCEELVESVVTNIANIRTSTCFCGCYKWKRSSSSNKEITNKITTMAEALLENFVEVVSKEASLKKEDEKLFHEHLNSVKSQLVDCGAIAANSKIAEQLEDLKNLFCTSYQLKQYQTAYYKRVPQMDAYDVGEIDRVLERRVFVDAVKQLIRNFQTIYGVKLSNYYIESLLVDFVTKTGVFRLKFQQTNGLDSKENSAIVKIPNDLFGYDTPADSALPFRKREVFVYEKLLPFFYELGECTLNPFAPRLYVRLHEATMILEDLSVDGYTFSHGEFLFDLDETVIFLKLLAKFHALGYKFLQSSNIKEQNMALIPSIQPLVFGKADPDYYRAFCDSMKSHLDETLITKILDMEKEVLAYPENINQPDEKTMIVIIHGDTHKKNIFFKYDKENKPCQVKILDFECTRFASPVSDLMEFFVYNVPIDVLGANENFILHSYLSTLNNNLVSLSANRKYDRPELDKDIATYKHNYLRLLSHAYRKGPRDLNKDRWILNLKNWLLYLEKKGLI